MKKKRLTNGANSPLRYPGGKGKITTFVGNVLEANGITGTYVEPFAGGAGIAINLLLAEKVESIVINDLDDGVASFWRAVIEDTEWLIDQIEHVPFDYNQVENNLGPEGYIKYWRDTKLRYENNRYQSYKHKGFDFFMLNRMNVSGIVKGGPIGGTSQQNTYNITSRFNRETLCGRILRIAALKDRITVTSFEASDFCKRLTAGDICETNDCLVFVDPPYFIQGKNLYNSYATDEVHRCIAESLLSQNKWKWVLTYDEAPEINELYPENAVNKYEYAITYSANKRGKYNEYLFSSPGLYVTSFDKVHLQRF